ncbi:MAG: permease, partial [Betaproteobacteria bacterium]
MHAIDRLPPATRHPGVALTLGAALWALGYAALDPLSRAIVGALPLEPQSRLAVSLQFFLYDAPKVLMLLVAVVFVMGMVNLSFTPERTRALLA